jgi:3-methyl-2-oxobutanoate hydroxymethyltransferase
MSIIPNGGNGSPEGKSKVTVPELLQRKTSAAGTPNNKKITCLTAYDYSMARLVDEAGVDVVLVGDSLGMVVLGYESTLPVTLDEMLHHTKAVRRGVQRALVVADMPYGTYHAGISEAVGNAMRFVKEAGAEAGKIEGGERRLELISRLTEAEIPVMGHVGLTPQSVNAMGGYRVQGKTPGTAEQLLGCSLGGSSRRVCDCAGRIQELATEITRTVQLPVGSARDRTATDDLVLRLLGLAFGPTEICAPVCQRGRGDFARGTECDDVQSATFRATQSRIMLPAQ